MLKLAAMYAGVALFLIAHVAFTYRAERHLKVHRLVTAAVIVALIPVAERMSALGALGLVTAVMVTLIAGESLRYAEARERIRHASDP
jgi:hypothetical protein